MFFGIRHAERLERAREVATHALLVLSKAPFNISRNARIEFSSLALENVNEIHTSTQ